MRNERTFSLEYPIRTISVKVAPLRLIMYLPQIFALIDFRSKKRLFEVVG
jgi:hypothetical protein